MRMDKLQKAKLAKKYEVYWHKMFFEMPKWKQQIVIEDAFGRHAQELSREVTLVVDALMDTELSGVV